MRTMARRMMSAAEPWIGRVDRGALVEGPLGGVGGRDARIVAAPAEQGRDVALVLGAVFLVASM